MWGSRETDRILPSLLMGQEVAQFRAKGAGFRVLAVKV